MITVEVNPHVTHNSPPTWPLSATPPPACSPTAPKREWPGAEVKLAELALRALAMLFGAFGYPNVNWTGLKTVLVRLNIPMDH